MSEQEQGNPGRKPDFIAYNVRDSQDGKGHWNRVGAAWKHKDGQGYDLALDSLPVDGRVSLRELREERLLDYAEERADPQRAPVKDRANARTRGHGRQR